MGTYLPRSQRAKVTSVRKIPTCHDVLSTDEPTLALPDAADLIGVAVTRIHALLQRGALLQSTAMASHKFPLASSRATKSLVLFPAHSLCLPTEATRERKRWSGCFPKMILCLGVRWMPCTVTSLAK